MPRHEDSASNRLRLGATSDLLSRPLIDGLELEPWSDRAGLTLEDRAEKLARSLDDGVLDAALLPPDLIGPRASRLEIVPGIGLSGEGASSVAVLLHSRPLAQLETIPSLAAGYAAETLCRLLFRAAHAAVDVVPWNRSSKEAIEEASCCLVAGDRAILERGTPDAARLDLGHAWTELTRLPFVWSVWCARPGVIDRERYALLHAVRSRGRQRMSDLLQTFAGANGLTGTNDVEHALAQIRFRLGRAQLAAIEQFWRSCAENDLLQPVGKPRLVTLTARGCS